MFNMFEERQKKKIAAQQAALEDAIIREQQVRNFFETDTGKYILKCIEDDKVRIKNALIGVEPDDVKAITKLQNEYLAVSRISTYFGKAILEGQKARELMFQTNSVNTNDYEM